MTLLQRLQFSAGHQKGAECCRLLSSPVWTFRRASSGGFHMGCIVLSVSVQSTFSSTTGRDFLHCSHQDNLSPSCTYLFLSDFILCSYLPWIASIYFSLFSTLSRPLWILILFPKVLTTPPSLASSANLMKLIKWKLNERLPLTSRGTGVNPKCLTSLRSGSSEIHLLLYRPYLLREKDRCTLNNSGSLLLTERDLTNLSK